MMACCCLSRDDEDGPRSAGGSGTPRPPAGALYEKYSLGQILGQGAFGVVYACTSKTDTSKNFAVKMVDKAESPMDEIQREIEMLSRLRHPMVVGLYDVYYEKVFICMVMECFEGGDLMGGMLAHWKAKGMIPLPTIKKVAAMIISGTEFLHSNSCVHRDIKADNFLMDRKPIETPDIKVALGDFGTVVDCKQGQRLKEVCGTQIYWSPEFYLNDYSLGVDVFALGVVCFGLCGAKFPFRSEQDIQTKTPKFQDRIPEEAQRLVLGMMHKEEGQRLDAAAARANPWLAEEKPYAEEEDKSNESVVVELKQEGANAGRVLRRAELVKRMEEHCARTNTSHGKKTWMTPDNFLSGFETKVTHGHHRRIKYRWMPKAEFDAHQVNKDLAQANGQDSKCALVENSADQTRHMLESHNVDLSVFGKGQAKTFRQFLSEISEGSARLMLDSAKYKTVVRVVDVTILRLSVKTPKETLYCVQLSEQHPDGRITRNINKLPAIKKLPHENSVQAARRCIEQHIKMSDSEVKITDYPQEEFEEAEDSAHYPGVQTVYRKEFVDAEVIVNDVAFLKRFSVVGNREFESKEEQRNISKTYAWCTEAQCAERKVKRQHDKQELEISAIVNTPVGLDEEQLKRLFQANGVDEEEFGQNGTHTLEEFSQELIAGQAVLRNVNGKVRRIVDVLVLKIVKPNGDVLMEAEETTDDGEVKELNRLPALKRRSDENQFIAAHRLMAEMQVNPNLLILNASNVLFMDETKSSTAYPSSIETVYHKRIISVEVAP